MIQYRDFSIRFSTLGAAEYNVRAECWLGSSESTFRPPFPLEVLRGLTATLGQAVRKGPTRGAGRAGGPDLGSDPTAVGREIFAALFHGPLGDLWEACRQALDAEKEGLRLRIHLSVDDGELAPLSQMPWELLCSDDPEAFVAMTSSQSIVRYLDGAEDHVPLPFSPPLRVLVVLANPDDWAPLDLSEEEQRIRNSWGQCPGVALDFLDVATLARMEKALQGGEYHVVHYMGHGDYDDSGGGVLILEDEDGHAVRVSGSTLGRLMRSERSLQLVFLNACDTARADASALTGVADSMVAAGVPAVVAMQFPVSDRAAIVFAEHFYDLLTTEHPVDAAVAGARRSVAEQSRGSLEWATPVLFMRAPDGVLFDFQLVYGDPRFLGG